MGGVQARKRVWLVLLGGTAAFLLLLGAVGLRSVCVGGRPFGDRAWYLRMQDIPIQRGSGVIYDRAGHELAFSIDVELSYAITGPGEWILKPPRRRFLTSSGMKYEDVLNGSLPGSRRLSGI
jgi:hypothetical protein